MDINISYLWVALIGLLTAFTELLSRYDNPRLIFTKFPSLFYILINMTASCLAFFFLNSIDFKIQINESLDNEVSKIIVAGTSAMLLLRSSFGNFKVNDQEINIGLAGIIQVLTRYSDRKFDQIFSDISLENLKRIMQNVDFEKAKKELPRLCMKLMKNLSYEEQNKIGQEVAIIEAEIQEDKEKFPLSKSCRLGIILSDYTGYKLLNNAIDLLGDEISRTKEDEQADPYSERLNKLKTSLRNL